MQKVINDFNTNKNKRNYKKSLESMIIKIKLLLGERKALIDKIGIKTEEDKLILSKIQQILIFLKYFEKFDLNSSLFVKESFLKELTKPTLDGEKEIHDYLDKKLNFLIQGNIKPEKVIGDLDIDVKSQLAPIFPLHFYNKFFPKIEVKEEQFILKEIMK